jgi:ribosome-associated protein YbcJ (S4-like RNA binding protein)
MDYLIYDDYIKLGDLLKDLDFISSGGQAKYYLPENPIQVDGEEEIRRGRKIYPNMTLIIEGQIIKTIAPNEQELQTHLADLEEKRQLQAKVKKMNLANKPKKKSVTPKQKLDNKPKFPGR